MVWSLNHTGNFPKSERFRLAKRIDDALFAFHRYLVRSTYDKADVRSCLAEADIELTLVRGYYQLALELKYTSPKQYQYAAEHLTEIGKLLGGWLKKV